jgi:hypothetical protein
MVRRSGRKEMMKVRKGRRVMLTGSLKRWGFYSEADEKGRRIL